VKNREKAKIHIGDRVPVITTTAATGGGFVSESVTYLDVGLKLDVEPTIYLEGDVGIKVGLEVSNIVKEVVGKTNSNTLTYQIGTRNANTTLRLHDGETQILAGLISNEDRSSASKVPGLGDFPLLGRLFSSHSDTKNKTEIVLLITPHVMRNINRPDAGKIEFFSGTDAAVGRVGRPFRTDGESSVGKRAEPVAPQGERQPPASVVVPGLPEPMPAGM
jgi:general secretion pathway protein D